MTLPDLTDEPKLLHIGRMTVLRQARRAVARKLRERMVPVLNAIENEGNVWDLTGAKDLIDQIEQINEAIAGMN